MNKKLVVIPVIVIVVIVALSGAYILLTQQAAPSQGGPYGSPASSSTEGATVRYKTASFVDTQGIGTKAFSMLIPNDWQSEGSIN